MSTPLIIALGAFTGLTIFLGLPFARLKRLPTSLQVFLNACATGILIFLLYDVISKAAEPINGALTQLQHRKGMALPLVLDLGVFVVGISVGLMGLVYFERRFIRRPKERVWAKSMGGEMPPFPAETLALMIAMGIGLHNFSEGLAIGQSAASGAVQLAAVLIIGFGLHNMTEGFGIAAPLTAGSASWAFLGLLGLVGGGPTFLGTLVGTVFRSEPVLIGFLALAAGAIIYVVNELLGVARMFKSKLASPEVIMWGVLLGFFAGYGTDLVITWSGI
jgi:ZIP family zinc transporter